MLTWFSVVVAWGGEPRIEDAGDARYLVESGRVQAAAAWYRARMEAEPADPDWTIAWLDALGGLPSGRHPGLVAEVEAWSAGHPEVEDAGAAVARAIALEAMGPYTMSEQAFPHGGGEWCEPALAVLETLPEAPESRVRVLQARLAAKAACRRSISTDWPQLRALYLSGDAGPFRRAHQVGVDDRIADLDALRAALDEEPWRTGSLAFYARERYLGGEHSDEARALILERARALAETDRPSRVAEAAEVFQVADLPDDELRARRRIQLLDPANADNMRRLGELVQRPPEPTPEVAAEPTVNPNREKLGTWLDSEWPWSPQAEALRQQLEAVAPEDRLDALRRLAKVDGQPRTQLPYAEAALAQGVRLRDATRVATDAIVVRRDALGPLSKSGEAWRAELVAALDLRARLYEAQAELARPESLDAHRASWLAADDLEEIMALDRPTADRLARLGRLYVHSSRWPQGIASLATALGDAHDTPVERAEAMALLTEIVSDGRMTFEGGVDGVIAAYANPPRPMARPAPRKPSTTTRPPRDPTLVLTESLTIDGRRGTLGGLEGVVVVDLWATWCGPCIASMPQFETFAARNAREATFVSLSVDENADVARQFVAKRAADGGERSTVAAYADPGTMKRLGIHGIPTYFVFSADDRLIAEIQGWKPERLEEALERASAK